MYRCVYWWMNKIRKHSIYIRKHWISRQISSHIRRMWNHWVFESNSMENHRDELPCPVLFSDNTVRYLKIIQDMTLFFRTDFVVKLYFFIWWMLNNFFLRSKDYDPKIFHVSLSSLTDPLPMLARLSFQ